MLGVRGAFPWSATTMLYQKKPNLVAMTTRAVQQLVNNSGLTLSVLVFVFLLLRLCEHGLKTSLPSKSDWRCFLSVTVSLFQLQLSSYLPAVLLLRNDLFLKFDSVLRLSENKTVSTAIADCWYESKLVHTDQIKLVSVWLRCKWDERMIVTYIISHCGFSNPHFKYISSMHIYIFEMFCRLIIVDLYTCMSSS